MKTALRNYINKYKITFACTGIFLMASLALNLLARKYPGYSQWHSEHISPLFVNTFGRVFSIFPFSFFELLLILAIISIAFSIIYGLILMLVRKSKFIQYTGTLFRRGVCLISAILLVFTLTASINYSKPPLTAGDSTSIREYTEEELIGLAYLLVDDIKELTSVISKDENELLNLEGLNLSDTSKEAMNSLGIRYGTLSGYYPNPKAVYLSDAMSNLGITGIFSPFTLEANYNKNVPSFIIPYTICHEFAHLKGFMREDEAGFLGYLACINSTSPEFKYSGTLNALLYTLNQLYSNVDKDTYDAVYSEIPQEVRAEINFSRDYWKSYTGTVTTAAKKANDKYLMVNAQDSGTKSYGMMVDLLLKEYEDQLNGKPVPSI